MASAPIVMQARGLVKRYGQVTALDGADFELRAGEILAVIGDNEGLRAGIPPRPRVVVLGGGFPVEEDGVRLGGIGVSGGSEAEDEACALAALQALGFAVPA